MHGGPLTPTDAGPHVREGGTPCAGPAGRPAEGLGHAESLGAAPGVRGHADTGGLPPLGAQTPVGKG